MNTIVPVTVDFLGAKLQGALKEGRRFVALRPIVEGMGLDWSSQHAKICANEIIGPTVVEITMVAEDGKRRPMTCIPEEYLQGWMFSIKPNKVRASLKSLVLRYQRECYRVLHDAFNAATVTAGPVRAEYLAGYHNLQHMVTSKAANSSQPWAAHLNVNRAINKAMGIEAGQRAVLPAGKLAMVSVAQQVACAAFAAANDHHDGYEGAKAALGHLALLLQPASCRIEQASHPPPKKQKASSVNCQPLPDAQSASTDQASQKTTRPIKIKEPSL